MRFEIGELIGSVVRLGENKQKRAFAGKILKALNIFEKIALELIVFLELCFSRIGYLDNSPFQVDG